MLLGIIMVILLVCGTAAAGNTSPVAKVQIPEKSFDFGQVSESQSLTHTFIIKNIGQAPLKIEKVDPDCACTAAEYDEQIPPGGQGQITLTIASFGVVKDFQKDSKIFFNDPNLPMEVLTLKGYSRPVIEIQPSHIIKFRAKPGEDYLSQVRLISHLDQPWEIKGLRTDIPDLIGLQLKTEEQGKKYLLEIRNKSQQVGKYKGLIELVTNIQNRPRIVVRVFAEIYAPGEKTAKLP
ncbi:MAG: DUF1573 domain-containing protein [Syntrophales bacterium]|nr:DUF1573 domain-containing protein [Syntrophales bacterium]